MKASLLLHREIVLADGKYVLILKVYEVGKSPRFPAGIKAKFVMKDAHGGFARLLVDNHEPHGFHMHTRLPGDPERRERLPVEGHDEALAIFMAEVERIIEDEKD